MKLESEFKKEVVKDLREMFPGCIILHDETQGYPDLIMLWEDRWAALEFKRSKNSSKRPNQEFYIEKFGKMSYSSFVFPENKEAILYELQRTLKSGRRALVSKSK